MPAARSETPVSASTTIRLAYAIPNLSRYLLRKQRSLLHIPLDLLNLYIIPIGGVVTLEYPRYFTRISYSNLLLPITILYASYSLRLVPPFLFIQPRLHL